jgi:hypothetical protein
LYQLSFMRLSQATVVAGFFLSVAYPVSAQLLPTNPVINPPPVTVDVPAVTIDPIVTDIVAPILPPNLPVPTTPVTLPTTGQVLDLVDTVASPIVDAVGNTVGDVITGSPVTLADGSSVIPLIDPVTQAVVGSIDPVTGAIATPDGQVVGNVTNQGGTGGSGSGSGTGGNSAGGSGGASGSNTNRVEVNNRNTFIAIPQPALGSRGKTTTEVLEEITPEGVKRNRVITTGYSESVPTLSISGGYAGGEGLGLIQLAIPLR